MKAQTIMKHFPLRARTTRNRTVAAVSSRHFFLFHNFFTFRGALVVFTFSLPRVDSLTRVRSHGLSLCVGKELASKAKQERATNHFTQTFDINTQWWSACLASLVFCAPLLCRRRRRRRLLLTYTLLHQVPTSPNQQKWGISSKLSCKLTECHAQ